MCTYLYGFGREDNKGKKIGIKKEEKHMLHHELWYIPAQCITGIKKMSL